MEGERDLSFTPCSWQNYFGLYECIVLEIKWISTKTTKPRQLRAEVSDVAAKAQKEQCQGESTSFQEPQRLELEETLGPFLSDNPINTDMSWPCCYDHQNMDLLVSLIE